MLERCDLTSHRHTLFFFIYGSHTRARLPREASAAVCRVTFGAVFARARRRGAGRGDRVRERPARRARGPGAESASLIFDFSLM